MIKIGYNPVNRQKVSVIFTIFYMDGKSASVHWKTPSSVPCGAHEGSVPCYWLWALIGALALWTPSDFEIPARSMSPFSFSFSDSRSVLLNRQPSVQLGTDTRPLCSVHRHSMLFFSKQQSAQEYWQLLHSLLCSKSPEPWSCLAQTEPAAGSNPFLYFNNFNSYCLFKYF
jgi:hypothetical protein